MKFRYFSYFLLYSIFSISQTYATNLNTTPNSRILNNSWSGAYFGLQYSFSKNKYKDPSTEVEILTYFKKNVLSITPATNKTPTKEFPKITFPSITNSSHLGGLFFGYNKAINNYLILGAELNTSFKLKASQLTYEQYPKIENENPKNTKQPQYTPGDLPLNRYFDVAFSVRLGINFGNFLPYITGGGNLLYNIPNKNIEYSDFYPESNEAAVDIKTKGITNLYLGWTLGVGCEYKLSQNLIIRAEYRYNHINSNLNKEITATVPIDNYNAYKDFHIKYGLENLSSHDIRIGLGYYF
ncbi:outer membrane protein [Bartonella sp. DGB1]|uniref:outer membrane protein n=1 Tax=Bartonella sp. DGB1 TaxID=3239807 RepID=UPI003524DCC9